jgi:hypothetical protein
MITIELRKYHFLEITPGDYSMDFELKESVKENGKETSRVRVKGFLKWDGCMNFTTEGYYHFCEDDDANLLNETFHKLWEIGPEHILNWSDS